MAFADDLKSEVISILKTSWKTRDGAVVPEPENVALGNDAVKLQGTILYADLAGSTDLVNKYSASFAAEIYKCYLNCASRIIKNNSGAITAFDGDRVMAVFIGERKNSQAARTALQINFAVSKLINEQLPVSYPAPNPNGSMRVRQAVGVDTSDLLVARTGIRGSNDLVWVGRAANYAAKLCGIRDGDYASWITADVYNRLPDDTKVMNGKPLWEQRTWAAHNLTVYRSNSSLPL